MDAIRVLLVDDHQVVREGLRRMLELESDLQIVGEASNAKEVLAGRNAGTRSCPHGYQDARHRRNRAYQATKRKMPQLQYHHANSV